MNKEIEELLNELKRRKQRYDYCKNNDISFSDEDYKSYLLLSYIEQLEKDKKELKDGWQQEIYDKNKVLNDWLEAQRKINILENNRDNAIECIEKQKKKMYKSRNKIALFILMKLENILKGDSDEK